MPIIPTELLETAIFLYPTEDDAKARTRWGGSGFLVGVPSETNESRVHLYAVTNDHVASGAPVVRLTLQNGEAAIINPNVQLKSRWIPHPDRDDVSVCSLGVVPKRDYFYVERDYLLADFAPETAAIDPGDDCFMIGRYVNHRGEQFDRPVLRFGNLAMLPEPINQPKRSFEQDSFLVDARSLPGFSGSQVWVYYLGLGTRTRGLTSYESMAMEKGHLLGINWGHLPVTEDVFDESDQKCGRMHVNSGMAAVVPAWKIRDLIDGEEDLVKPRNRADEELAKDLEGAPVLDASEPDEFARTEDLTRGLLRVPKKELDEKRREEG